MSVGFKVKKNTPPHTPPEAMQREMARSKEAEEHEAEYDMVTDMTCAEDLRADAAKLLMVLEEKESLENEVEGLKKLHAENELKMKDLERKLSVMKMKEIEERNKRIRVEEEIMVRDKIYSQNKKISVWRQGINALNKFKKVVAGAFITAAAAIIYASYRKRLIRGKDDDI